MVSFSTKACLLRRAIARSVDRRGREPRLVPLRRRPVSDVATSPKRILPSGNQPAPYRSNTGLSATDVQQHLQERKPPPGKAMPALMFLYGSTSSGRMCNTAGQRRRHLQHVRTRRHVQRTPPPVIHGAKHAPKQMPGSSRAITRTRVAHGLNVVRRGPARRRFSDRASVRLRQPWRRRDVNAARPRARDIPHRHTHRRAKA